MLLNEEGGGGERSGARRTDRGKSASCVIRLPLHIFSTKGTAGKGFGEPELWRVVMRVQTTLVPLLHPLGGRLPHAGSQGLTGWMRGRAVELPELDAAELGCRWIG